MKRVDKLMKRMKRFKATSKYSKKQMLVFIGLFAVVGVAALLITKAATAVSNIEPEQGSPTNAITVVNGEPAASGNAYIRFGTGQTVPNTGCWLPGAAYCENFEGGVQSGQSGDFDAAKISTSRFMNEYMWVASSDPQGGYVAAVPPGDIPACRTGSVTNPFPPADTLICNPNSVIGTHFGLTSVSAHNYGDNSYRIAQPFDVNNRTGKIVFDANLDIITALFGWAQLSFTADPIAVPGYYEDNARSSAPGNGILIQFNQRCRNQLHTITPAIRTFTDFRSTNLTYRSNTDNDYDNCSTNIATKANQLNRVEVRLSKTKVEVYISDYSADGLTYSTPKLASSYTIDLPFTRGYVHFGAHNHATLKYSEPGAGQGADHSIASWVVQWDNIAFDGPVITPDRDYQVADARVPNRGYMDLGWRIPEDGSATPALSLPGVSLSGVTTARLSLSLHNNVYSDTPPANQILKYRLNNGPWHNRNFLPGEVWSMVTRWEGSPFNTGASNPVIDVPLSELVNGNNTVQFGGQGLTGTPVIANVDLLLR